MNFEANIEELSNGLIRQNWSYVVINNQVPLANPRAMMFEQNLSEAEQCYFLVAEFLKTMGFEEVLDVFKVEAGFYSVCLPKAKKSIWHLKKELGQCHSNMLTALVHWYSDYIFEEVHMWEEENVIPIVKSRLMWTSDEQMAAYVLELSDDGDQESSSCLILDEAETSDDEKTCREIDEVSVILRERAEIHKLRREVNKNKNGKKMCNISKEVTHCSKGKGNWSFLHQNYPTNQQSDNFQKALDNPGKYEIDYTICPEETDSNCETCDKLLESSLLLLSVAEKLKSYSAGSSSRKKHCRSCR